MIFEFSILAVLLLCSGFFSCSESALTSLPKTKLAQIKKHKIRGYKKLLYLKENPGIMLATILVGNNLVNISISALGTLTMLRVLNSHGIYNDLWITAITTVIITLFVLVFGEVTPKTIGLANSQRFALFSSQIIIVLARLFKPVVFVLNKFSGLILLLLGQAHKNKGLEFTEEELLSVIETGQETGVIEKEEKNMLHDVIRFGDSFVGEIMTPLDNVLAAEANDTIETLLDKIKDRLPSRIPVYAGAKHNIIGILYLKDLLQKITATAPDYKQKRLREFQELLRPPFVVYIDQKSAYVMRHMRFQHIHIALVKNHLKKTVGIVTFEDLLEEIIGEIKDEYEKN